jgi:hypothetical protein
VFQHRSAIFIPPRAFRERTIGMADTVQLHLGLQRLQAELGATNILLDAVLQHLANTSPPFRNDLGRLMGTAGAVTATAPQAVGDAQTLTLMSLIDVRRRLEMLSAALREPLDPRAAITAVPTDPSAPRS